MSQTSVNPESKTAICPLAKKQIRQKGGGGQSLPQQSPQALQPAEYIGQQLVADLYGCDRALLDDLEGLKAFIHRMCREIHTEIVEESYHKFSPIGISAYAVITTSHFSIHTWPEFGYAAVDIFSCDGRLTLEIGQRMQKLLGADRMVTRLLDRQVTETPTEIPIQSVGA